MKFKKILIFVFVLALILVPAVSAADGSGFLQIWRNKTTEATLPGVPLITECFGDVSGVAPRDYLETFSMKMFTEDNNNEVFRKGKIYKFEIDCIIDMLPSDPSGSLDEFFILGGINNE